MSFSTKNSWASALAVFGIITFAASASEVENVSSSENSRVSEITHVAQCDGCSKSEILNVAIKAAEERGADQVYVYSLSPVAVNLLRVESQGAVLAPIEIEPHPEFVQYVELLAEYSTTHGTQTIRVPADAVFGREKVD